MTYKRILRKVGQVASISTLCVGALLTAQCENDDVLEETLPGVNTISPKLVVSFSAMQSPKESKTSISENGKVSWDANDNLKAFIVTPGNIQQWAAFSYKYITNSQDCINNIFRPDQEKAPQLNKGQFYDWYVMSPYSDKVNDPVAQPDLFGNYTEFTFDGQSQSKASPMSHITAFDVMTGVEEHVKAEDLPNLKLKHQGVLMKFTIVNNGQQQVTLNKIEFIADSRVNIGGTYAIDFRGEGQLVPQKASNISTLHLKDRPAINQGESLETYVMMPPFTIEKGKSFTIKAYTDKGVGTQSMTAGNQAIVFKKGTKNTATVRFSEYVQQGAVFAKGVSKEKGWYDVNKKRDGLTGDDAVLCWAAVSANMLEWWQDRYREVNGSLPTGAVSGPGQSYELAIFELFQRDWVNTHGSQVYYGIPWYFTGENLAANATNVAKPKPGTGGFYKDQWAEISPIMGENYVYPIEAYSTWGDGWGVDMSRDPLEVFTTYVVDAISNGVASISIQTGYSSFHAQTLWGYELNEQGMVNKVYVTDSDNQISRPNEPRESILSCFDVVRKAGTRDIGITGAYGNFNMISQIIPFRGYR